MTDYSDLINSSFGPSNPALPPVVGNIGEDPEKAQRAYDLSKATGVPSSAIYGDLDAFESQNKASMASAIVRGNPHLADFVNSDPMVPKIANDDYGNLDSVSQKVTELGLGRRITHAFGNALTGMMAPDKAFKEGFGDQPIGSWLSSDDIKNYPIASAVAAGLATPLELFFRGLSGATRSITEDIRTGTGAVFGEKAGKEFAGMAEAELMGLTGRHGGPPLPEMPRKPQAQSEAGPYRGPNLGPVQPDPVARARPYVENGREPPPTILPEYDKFRADRNAQDLDALKEATQDAQSSLLRERNPDLFRQFIAQHTDAEIGVSGEVVAALYGDKVPTTDDGLLGWVPGIADKLKLAREAGDDVHIPLSDWLANIDPKVMDALKDDIRVRPGGITANEVKAASEAKEALPEGAKPSGSDPLPELVPSLRAATALEPLLSVGDRKLELQRIGKDLGDERWPDELATADGRQWDQLTHAQQAQYQQRANEGRERALNAKTFKDFHDFNMLDEHGNSVGTINLSAQKDGKQLYVEMINGVNGLGPRDFGPALMRDLLRQLKAEFPEAESITGHRVSGAREKAGTYMASSASPVVKLDRLDDTTAQSFREILHGGQWETYSPNTKAYIKPDFARSEQDRQLVDIVNDELDRIVPNKVAIQGADTIKVDTKGLKGQREGEDIRVGGTYIRYKETYPIILYALDSQNALGSARHEAIHHLRQYGFFSLEEWRTLEAQALAGGWLSKYRVDSRYPTGKPDLKLEEAVAEAYTDWTKQKDSLADRARQLMGVESPLDTIFRKMQDFFDRIKQRIGDLLGKDPTWEDIFQKVSTGEVGGREGTEPLDARAFNEKLSVEPPEGGSRVFERAASLGMTVDQFKRYDELIAKRHAEDVEAATERALKEKAREQTKQWKDDRKALRVEVADNIKQRPDVAADLFFGSGELYGKKVPLGSVKLDASALTEAQKAALPRNYYGEHGLHPDDVANLFGYGSGATMLDHLVAYNQAKLTAGGMSAKDFVSRVTDIETDRQMHIRHGVLEDNIMDAVKEHVVGETQINLLAEETYKFAMDAGQAPLAKDTLVASVRQEFAKSTLASVSSDRYMAAAGRAGREAEMGLLNNDPAAAFVAKQRQFYATVLAREAAQLEKELGKFDKLAKRFSKREVASVDQEYTNFIHDILLRVGRPVRRSVQDLETEIAAGEYKDLQSFVEGKEGFYLREVAVADMFFDPKYRKKFDDLTVDEFKATNDSIKSLVSNGRDERKISKAGAEADLKDIKAQMIDSLERFQEKTYDAKGGRWMGIVPPKQAAILRTYGIDHLQMETIFNRWDNADPNGVFQQYVMRDLVTASNSESAKRKTYAARLLALDDGANLKESIDNPIFKAPKSDRTLPMNRANLRAVLLNVGNASNLDKLARGYDIPKEQVLAWVHTYATKEDWDWAQKMGDLFADLKKESDLMYRNLSGVASESIPLESSQTPHGEYKGWYYPLIAHPEFEGPTKRMMGPNALEQDGFVRATTSNGYTKARTGVAYPLALDLDMLPPRIAQMIHDIEMRPAIINASKIFYDKDVRGTITSRFGNEWRDMLAPYLVDVANGANYMPKGQKRLASVSEFIRQNMITTLVGMNPGTFMKHTPTALIQSIREVGTPEFLQAMKGLWSTNERTGESNWQFALRESEELQRRHTHFQETLGGAGDQLVPDKGYASLRSTVNYYASYPVAMGDLMSAVPTWLAQYTKETRDGATHGDAVYMADRAVRRAHGSTAITNRSAVMRGGYSPWLASVYGFFNHIMNRQYEMTWKAGEMTDMVKAGDYAGAMAEGKSLTANLFAYVLAPAIIEELVSPLTNDEHESWGKKAAKGLTYTLGSSWIGIRDVANAVLNGRDPNLGLATTALKTFTDVFRDLSKDKPLGKEHAGKLVKDASTLLGTTTGLLPAQAGKVAEFGHGVATGLERPKGPWGWLTGTRYGTLKGHPATAQDWARKNLGVR